MGLAIAAVVLAAIGFVDSLYFVAVYYTRCRYRPGLVPAFCSPDNGACRSILDAPQAHVFGVPNSVLGLGYYALVLASAAYRLASGQWAIPQALFGISVAAALISVYLAWSLIFRMRTTCPLCFLAQAINLALLGVFAALL